MCGWCGQLLQGYMFLRNVMYDLLLGICPQNLVTVVVMLFRREVTIYNCTVHVVCMQAQLALREAILLMWSLQSSYH